MRLSDQDGRKGFSTQPDLTNKPSVARVLNRSRLLCQLAYPPPSLSCIHPPAHSFLLFSALLFHPSFICPRISHYIFHLCGNPESAPTYRSDTRSRSASRQRLRRRRRLPAAWRCVGSAGLVRSGGRRMFLPAAAERVAVGPFVRRGRGREGRQYGPQ